MSVFGKKNDAVEWLGPWNHLLIRKILEAPTAFPWSLQGFGMFRLYLSRAVRLHVWSPAHARERVHTIHTHPWHFVSHVVAGRITDRVYDRFVNARGGAGDDWTEERIVCGQGGGATGERSTCRLGQPVEHTFYAGDTYRRDASDIHESIAVEGTVTIVQRTFLADTEHASVFHPVDTEWVSAEPRDARSEEVRAMAKQALAAMDRIGQPW